MIDLSMTFEKMKEEIEFSHYVFDQVISPEKNPEYFIVGFENLKKLNSFFLNFIPAGTIEDLFGEFHMNSSWHGNNYDEKLSFEIKLAYGNKGFVGQIIDSGRGFDYKKILELKRAGKIYYKNGGVGFFLFDLPGQITASYEGKGNISNLMWKKEIKTLISL